MNVTMKEERTELQTLRERAEQDGQDAADTLAALAGKFSEARHPGTVVRRTLASAQARARHIAQTQAKRLGDLPPAKRAALAGIPVGLITFAALAILPRGRTR